MVGREVWPSFRHMLHSQFLGRAMCALKLVQHLFYLHSPVKYSTKKSLCFHVFPGPSRLKHSNHTSYMNLKFSLIALGPG